ncbi:Somatostatin receptor type 5 [Trichoplax sp. H2]|nr:Somatostatin receptor type 5 [Trichoplax sp. H2]|eukprot:RDD40855.1 Somatostatin receptor type 5 [Trichoplax sp. H2]
MLNLSRRDRKYDMNNSANNDTPVITIFAIYQFASAIAIPIFIIGLLLNLFMLYIFLVDRHFKTTTYTLIGISVVSDTISVCSMLVGVCFISDSKLDFIRGQLFCRLTLIIIFASFFVSMMNLCLIGIDRYYSIVKPFSTKYKLRKPYIIGIAEFFFWLLAIVIHLPLYKYVSVYPQDPLLCDFLVITPSISSYLITHAVISFVIPSIILGVVYGKIVIYQKSYRRPGNAIDGRQIEKQSRMKRIIKVLISISVCYIALSWPFFASTVGMAITSKSLMDLRQESSALLLLAYFSVIITLSITILNPLIYLKFDNNIRKRSLFLLNKMKPRRCRGRSRINPTESFRNAYRVN